MTRFFTLLFAAAVSLTATTTAIAQTVTYPYNPDGNDDQYISIYDLQDLLMAYGQPWTPQELAVDSIPLSAYLQTLQAFIEANALPPGTQAGQFLKWDGAAWVLVVPKVGCTDPEACTYDAEATTLLELHAVIQGRNALASHISHVTRAAPPHQREHCVIGDQKAEHAHANHAEQQALPVADLFNHCHRLKV